MIGWAALGAAAAAAAATGARARWRERAALAAFPPEGVLTDVDGVRVHSVTRGEGRDVVLIHGASGSTRDMTHSLLPRLAARYRVTAFDRPGLGHTDRAALDGGRDPESPSEQAAVLRAAARRLGLRRPIVVGHSLGGAVALAWALDAPSEVGAVVDLSGVSMPWPGSLDWLYRANGSALGGAWLPPLLAAWLPRRSVDTALRAIFEPDPVPDGYAAHFGPEMTLRRDSIRANARQVTRLRPHVVAMVPRYPAFEVPLEILHGEADIIVPPTIHSVPLARLVPGANLVMLPGVGHMPHHAAPDAVLAAVDRAAARAPA